MRAFGILLFLLASASLADGLEQIAGHYRYTDYSVLLPSGQKLTLADLGAQSATLDIAVEGTITLTMVMHDRQIVTQSARVISSSYDGRQGYWLAQWPEMNYAVRAEFVVTGRELRSRTRFDNPLDAQRFRSIETAVLRR